MKYVFSALIFLVSWTLLRASAIEDWPTKGWRKATPASMGIDEAVLAGFDADLASGKYPLVDSMTVIRCGELVYQRKYSHDYAKIFAKEAHEKGPLNAHLAGPYNYFDPAWHPYYHGTDEHSMQSVSKSVTSATLGIAITRKDFKGSLETPVLKYFNNSTVKNLDERKRRMTIRDVLTMSTGLDWNEDVAYNDPKNAASLMEATDDWVQFVIDLPMAHDPGTVFAYSSGATELLAYIFQKDTGQDIEEYAKKYLFTPLGIEHYYWKRTPKGLPDTEGGLFLRAEDLAKIGYLYLHNGVWEGKQIVSTDWVKQSLTPAMDAGDGWKYGFQWWLLPHGNPQRLMFAGLGFGGQTVQVVPEENVIMVFTGWNILGNTNPIERDPIKRILPGLRPHGCALGIH